MFLLSNNKYLPVNETVMDNLSEILLMLLLLLLKLAISGDVKRVQDNFNNKSIQTTSASLLRHIWKLQCIILIETPIPLNLASPKAANFSSDLGKKRYVTFTETDDSSTRKTVTNYAKRKDNTHHAVEDTHVIKNIGLIPVWRYSINREKRDIPDYCYKFHVGDEIKQEFYSPGYPGHYGPNLN